MSKKFQQLGKVESVMFGFEDHGILTFMIYLNYGGSCQGFGGYALDTYDKEKKRRVGTAAGTDLILKLLNLFKVSKLDDIEGRSVFALRDSDNWTSSIVGLKLPDFDGGEELLISDWQKEWFPEK